MIEHAKYNLVQSVETIIEGCQPQGDVSVEAHFDEFSLDVRISYSGAPLELPTERPTLDAIAHSDAGHRLLAGFLLRQFADRVQATHKGGRSTILFHFDH